MDKSWVEKIPISEVLTIAVLGIIAMGAMAILGADSKDLVIAVGSGLVGYLAKGNPA